MFPKRICFHDGYVCTNGGIRGADGGSPNQTTPCRAAAEGAETKKLGRGEGERERGREGERERRKEGKKERGNERWVRIWLVNTRAGVEKGASEGV
jgi:hypothetical protein